MKRIDAKILGGGLLAALLITAPLPCEADEYVDLPCWATMTISSITVPPTDRSSQPWADQAVDQTAAGGGTATQSWGFEFDEPSGSDPEIQCTWIVPETYNDSTGNIPQVTLMGWSITDSSCIFDSSTKYVEFGVSSRPYAAAETANHAWSTEEFGSASFACVEDGCGSGIDCHLSDTVKSVTIDAAQDVGDWEPGDLVFIRIRRDSVSPSLSQVFHVARVRLRWPLAN